MKNFRPPVIVTLLYIFAIGHLLIPILLLFIHPKPNAHTAMFFWVTGIGQAALASIIYYAARTAHYTEQMVLRQLMRERESAGQF